MQSSEGGFKIDIGCKNWDIGEELLNGDGQINNPLDACSKHARQEFFCFDATVG